MSEGLDRARTRPLGRTGLTVSERSFGACAIGGSSCGAVPTAQALRRAGKIHFAGVSLRSAGDVDHALARPGIDVLQMPASLLDPGPLVSRMGRLRERGAGVTAAVAYPLSFDAVSTLILSCKHRGQVETNLGGPAPTLSAGALQRIAQVQRRLGLVPASPALRLSRRAKSLLRLT